MSDSESSHIGKIEKPIDGEKTNDPPYRDLWIGSLFSTDMPVAVINGLMTSFGYSLRITEEFCREFACLYDWEMFAEKLLSRKGHEKFVTERHKIDEDLGYDVYYAANEDEYFKLVKKYDQEVGALFARIYIAEGENK